MKIRHVLAAAGCIAASLIATSAAAQTTTTQTGADLSQLGLSRSQVRALNDQLTAPAVAPGISFGSPVGFGAGWGEGFLGVGGNTLPTDSNNPDNLDGSASVGFGLGDPYKYAALETTVTAISLRDSFADSGNINFKLSRALPGNSSLAIGQDNTVPWGPAKDVRKSSFAAFTTVFTLAPDTPRNPWALSVNVGVGNHRFVDPGKSNYGPFGSVAIVPWRQLSFVVDYTGRDVNAALSIVPFPRLPVVLTLGAINLGERLNRQTEFAGGLGYVFRF